MKILYSFSCFIWYGFFWGQYVVQNGVAIGGICYRPYMHQKFAEIAFCAITASEQVKGFGTHLMNHVKLHVKRLGLTHFLTYADNYAIGYFKKQGKNILY